MPAVTTEGLILKRSNFGEADRVLTVLTDRYGKISVIAKGVRRITSRRAGNVELLNRVKLHLFKAKNYNLTEAESIETFPKLKENLTLSTTAFHILELIDRLTAEEQKSPKLYELSISIFRILEQNPRQIFIRGFEVKILSLLGFWSINAIKELNEEQKNILEKLEYQSWEKIGEIDIGPEQSDNLEKILRFYLEKILESSLKSVKVLKDLKK
ncbi:DNA repair protein RecO [Candidatus Daviesbacteria bacterium]|nr:DNA repair protein RecO [Candidatus Daviesbacteria bacterium]